MSPGRRSRAAIALPLVTLLLFGCAAAGSARDTVEGWFGSSTPPPRAYYAGVARAKLRRAPEPSSEVVGELGLHEGVLAYQVEGGFTFVTAEKSGRSGWARQVDLIDRLPRQTKPATTSMPAKGPPGPEPATTEPAETGPEPAETGPEPETPPENPERSVFDPY